MTRATTPPAVLEPRYMGCPNAGWAFAGRLRPPRFAVLRKARVLMRTDWSKRGDPEAYQDFDETGKHTPGRTPKSCSSSCMSAM